MSNSSLVNFTKISPNKTVPRNHTIDTITIHCVVGQLSVEAIGNIFAPASRQASSNYGIGSDGRIGMYVEEKDRSWCSSSKSNDHRAITIECSCDPKPPYAINDKVYASLIKLCTDICKRNNIKELKWKADKTLIGNPDKQNMTVHRWFSATECPGEHIYNRLGQIASDVNSKLSNTNINQLYCVQTGAYSSKANAESAAAKLKAAGFDACVVIKTDKSISTTSKKSIDEIAKEVILGKWGNGEERKERLIKAGYDYSAIQKRVNELL